MAAGEPVTAYAFARTGYHRGLDQLRRAGWHGHGPVPGSTSPTRASCARCTLLGAAAAAIGEDDEAARCQEFLADSSPAAVPRWDRTVLSQPGRARHRAVGRASGWALRSELGRQSGNI